MGLYKRILEYYLDTRIYFVSRVSNFFEYYEHWGKCQNIITGEIIDFETSLYRQAKMRELKEYGFHLNLPEKMIQQYFVKSYDEDQLFAIFLAHWFQLKPSQIRQVEDKRCSRLAMKRLHFFLCNRQKEKYDSAMENLLFHWNEGHYLLCPNMPDKEAVYKNGYLSADGQNFIYRIIDEAEYDSRRRAHEETVTELRRIINKH